MMVVYEFRFEWVCREFDQMSAIFRILAAVGSLWVLPSAALALAQAPDFSKAFNPNPVAVNGVSTLTYTLDNAASAMAAESVDFTDNLPAGLVIATPANASTTCQGGTLTAPDGGSSIAYTGGVIPASSACVVVVNTRAPSSAGDLVSVSGDLTSSLGNSGVASSTLEVVEPVFFLPLPYFEGFESYDDQVFTSGNVVVDVPGLRYENSPGGRFALRSDLAPGGSRLAAMDNPGGASTNSLIFGIDASSLPAGQQLFLDFRMYRTGDEVDAEDIIEVRGSVFDPWVTLLSFPDLSDFLWHEINNVEISQVLFNEAQILSNTAQIRFTQSDNSAIPSDGISIDDIAVGPSLKFSKVFEPSRVLVGNQSTLTFTIRHRGSLNASNISFTDDLPAGMILASSAGAATNCIGNLSAADGGSTVSFTSGALAPGMSCIISVDVVATAAGDLVSTSGALLSTAGDSGSAQATLVVFEPDVFEDRFEL